MKFEWKCPKCDAHANCCGKKNLAQEGHDNGLDSCMGFICECDVDTDERHGETLADPCTEARCWHCGWGGTYPKAPKGLQAWEKKALEAGWTMPTARAQELEQR